MALDADRSSTEPRSSMMRSFVAGLAVSLVAFAASAAPVDYTFDLSHSNIGFKVPHLVVSSVSGRFKEVASSQIKLDDQDLTKSQISIDIKAGSVDTGDAKRDEHLRGADFFDVAKHPLLKFSSTKITKAGKGYKLVGDLTIRGVKKSVTLDGTVSEPVKTPWGKHVRAIKLAGSVKRGDFGLTWNKALEAGGVIVGEDVALTIEAEVMK
jgi:polyisoprenoid-binding protein YceI